MHLEVTRRVAASPAHVWSIVSDVAHSADVVSAIESVEMLDGASPVEVGTRWRETRTMFGRQASEEMTVTAVDPGRSYTVQAHAAGTTYESTVSVTPVGDSGAESDLTLTLAVTNTSTASRLLGATLGRAMSGATRKVLEGDLNDLARAAEGTEGADQSGGRPVGP